MNRQIPITMKNNQVMPVSLMIPEKQILTMCTVQIFPILAGNLDRRCLRMFQIIEFNTLSILSVH